MILGHSHPHTLEPFAHPPKRPNTQTHIHVTLMATRTWGPLPVFWLCCQPLLSIRRIAPFFGCRVMWPLSSECPAHRTLVVAQIKNALLYLICCHCDSSILIKCCCLKRDPGSNCCSYKDVLWRVGGKEMRNGEKVWELLYFLVNGACAKLCAIS